MAAPTSIQISILDQSIVYHGKTAKDAIDETIAVAKYGEKLGYHRFWVSEHHNSTFIAGSTPELLMVKLANDTDHIRIGSGGIMLPNHSAYKVAENFRMLETLFPERIDLGMGRAPGTDRVSASLLNPSNKFAEADYITQLEHLQHFFNDTAATQYGKILAVPQTNSIPEQWILSSSGGSATIAAKFGMGLAVAKFINGNAGKKIVDDYRKNFVPSDTLKAPKELVGIFVVCAETEEKALALRKYMNYVQVQFELGNFNDIGNAELAKNYVFTPQNLISIENNKGKIISGTQAQVKTQIEHLAKEMDVKEIMISTMAFSLEDRLRSFELIAEAFNLNKI